MTTETQLLRDAEVSIANLISYQSSQNGPTIHEFGQARRTLDAIRAALSAPAQPTTTHITWDSSGRRCVNGVPDAQPASGEVVATVYTMEALDPLTYDGSGPRCHVSLLKELPVGTKLYTAPQPAQPAARVAMTDDQVWHSDAIMSANGIAGFKMDALMRIVRAVESHHGIGGITSNGEPS